MKTTHQKFYPTATPPDGAVYIGSIDGAWKCDLYLSGDDVHQFLSPTERARHRVKCIQEADESGHEWYIAASSLIRAYREKQSTPTPMTREGIIETLARAGYDYLRVTGAFDRLSIEGREKILGAAEAQAIAIGVVKLCPAPEPVKSDGYRVADAMVTIDTEGARPMYRFRIGYWADSASGNNREWVDSNRIRLVSAIAPFVDAALAARDRQHAETLRKELEAYRECIIDKLVSDGFIYLTDKIRAIPLTIAEREAAK